MPPITEAPRRFHLPIEEGSSFGTHKEIYRFDPEKMWRIAEQMVDFSLDIQEGDRLLIEYHPGGRQLVEMIGYQAAERGAAVMARANDPSVGAAILAGVEKHGPTEKIFEEMIIPRWGEIGWATKVVHVRSDDTPDALDIVNKDIMLGYAQAFGPRLHVRVDRRRWALIYIPTPAEAALDSMDYGEYVNTFLNACDRPWQEVEQVQDILIDILRRGNMLEFYADEENADPDWQTHLRMSIEGMVFANSTIRLNFPGSEVFSGPKRKTIEGQLAIPYNVKFGGKVLPNLRLTFQEGRVVNHFTAGDMDWVEAVLSTDEGAREVGEIAFGTNPAFRKPFLNGLYVEKVGGSFHLAVGGAYPYTEFAGRPVVIDNGVRSDRHEDLTRMMLSEYGGGRVLLDGKLIQENGFFQDTRLALLNPTNR